jgi:Flp pilus assembly protein TadD
MSRDYLFGDAKATAKAVDAGRKQKALSQAQQAYEETPSPQNQTRLATALFDLGRFQEAEKLLRDILEKNENDLKVLSDLGFVYKNLNQRDKAKEIFLRIVAINPRHPLARSAENEVWTIDPSYLPSWMRRD